MRFLEKTIKKYRLEWRVRSSRRISIWHLPKIILSFVLLGLFWYLLFTIMWQIHLVIYPHHLGLINQFWSKGIGLRSFISSFLMVMPLFLPAMGAAFILTNLLFWYIIPARTIYEIEAAGDQDLTFSGATSGLIKIFLRFLLPIGLGLSLVGALTLSSLG